MKESKQEITFTFFVPIENSCKFVSINKKNCFMKFVDIKNQIKFHKIFGDENKGKRVTKKNKMLHTTTFIFKYFLYIC